jgi:hypothetical protein
MPHDPTPLMIILIALLLGALVLGLTRRASIGLLEGPPIRRSLRR